MPRRADPCPVGRDEDGAEPDRLRPEPAREAAFEILKVELERPGRLARGKATLFPSGRKSAQL